MDRYFERKMDHHQRMETHLNLQFSRYVWTVDIVEAKRQRTKLRAFTVEPIELSAINMDCYAMLSLLIANDTTDRWVAMTESFDYLTLKEKILPARPGEDIDGIRVIRLYLKPEPERFPYVEFEDSLHEICDVFKANYHQFLFEYNSIRFENPTRFVTFLEHARPSHDLITQSIMDYHQANISWLRRATVTNPSKPVITNDPLSNSMTREQKIKLLKATLHSLTVEEELVQELKLSRKEMAQVLNVKVNTIRSWEKGEAPCEHAWPKPGKNSRKHTEYPVVIYLPAMQQLQYNR